MKHRGFSLLIALLIMVIIAVFSTLIISLSAKSRAFVVSEHSDIQAELLAISGTEYALLAISGHNHSVSCVDAINIAFPKDTPKYDINISISYFGRNLPCVKMLDNNIRTKESDGTVMIDVHVHKLEDTFGRYNYHRRTLQKP